MISPLPGVVNPWGGKVDAVPESGDAEGGYAKATAGVFEVPAVSEQCRQQFPGPVERQHGQYFLMLSSPALESVWQGWLPC